MGNFGFWEILIVFLIVLILFGGRKIPQLAKDLGIGIREFKKTMGDAEQEVSNVRGEIEDSVTIDGVDKKKDSSKTKAGRSKKS